MDLAQELAGWPVDSAAVAVVGRDGPLDVLDDGRSHPWASVTKIVTAMAVLDAVTEGVVALDDPVGPPGATLAHLLAHASGLALDEDRSLARPGTRRIYSNLGIDLAAAHLERRTGRRFADELRDRVLVLLDMNRTELVGPPAHGARGPVGDLARLAGELLTPRLALPEVVRRLSTVAFPGLPGVVPGFGRQSTNDWGLGCEIRDHKDPHWTAPTNAPTTFGHFGQSGSFLWVDPEAGLACAFLCDRAFGSWAAERWPTFSARVLEHYRGR